jgi:hypothetical protein
MQATVANSFQGHNRQCSNFTRVTRWTADTEGKGYEEVRSKGFEAFGICYRMLCKCYSMLEKTCEKLEKEANVAAIYLCYGRWAVDLTLRTILLNGSW